MDKRILWAALSAAFCVCIPVSGQAGYSCEPKSATIQATAFVERPLGFTFPESTEQQREGIEAEVSARGLLWVRYARPEGVVVQIDSRRVPVTRSSRLMVARTQWEGIDILAVETDRSLVRVDAVGEQNAPDSVTITIISTDN